MHRWSSGQGIERYAGSIWSLPGRVASILGAAMLVLWFITSASIAGSHVALVIGNAAYTQMGSLSNPIHDAEDIAATLRAMGFDVTVGSNVETREFAELLSNFATAAEGAEVAVFYFAGHGLQYQSENYLLPIDATLTNRFALNYETVPLDAVMHALEGARTALIFVDACRSLPMEKTFFARVNERIVPARGLAEIERRRNVFVGLSASAGETAADGSGRNSPFASAMLAALPTPGVTVSSMFGRVIEGVVTATGGAQKPQGFDGIAEPIFLMDGQATTGASGDPAAEERAYQAVQKTGTVGAYRAFIAKYPSGLYSALAREEITILEQGATPRTDGGTETKGLDTASSAIAECSLIMGDGYDPNYGGPRPLYDQTAYAFDLPRGLKACEAAYAEDRENPALMYLLARSLGSVERASEALPLLEAAAGLGYVPAKAALGNTLIAEKENLANVRAGLALLEGAVDAGYAMSAYSLGIFHQGLYGQSELVQPELAAGWFRRGAEAGEPNSMAFLGDLYERGAGGVTKDLRQAAFWYDKAASLKNFWALEDSARFYALGLGGVSDYAKAADAQLEYCRIIVCYESDFETWPREAVATVQRRLADLGYDPGPVDGSYGDRTQVAMGKFMEADVTPPWPPAGQ